MRGMQSRRSHERRHPDGIWSAANRGKCGFMRWVHGPCAYLTAAQKCLLKNELSSLLQSKKIPPGMKAQIKPCNQICWWWYLICKVALHCKAHNAKYLHWGRDPACAVWTNEPHPAPGCIFISLGVIMYSMCVQVSKHITLTMNTHNCAQNKHATRVSHPKGDFLGLLRKMSELLMVWLCVGVCTCECARVFPLTRIRSISH